MRLNYVLILLSIILSVFLVCSADGKDSNSAMVTIGYLSDENKTIKTKPHTKIVSDNHKSKGTKKQKFTNHSKSKTKSHKTSKNKTKIHKTSKKKTKSQKQTKNNKD
jgi:hypothetical protein